MQHNSIQPTLQGEQQPTIPQSSMQQQPINKTQTSRFYLDVPSPLGTLRLESDGEALTALHLKTQKRCIQPRWHGTKPPNCPCLKKCKRGSRAILEVKTQVNAHPFGLRAQRFSKPFGNNCWPYPTPKPLPTALWPHT